jgi:hypothetical protein
MKGGRSLPFSNCTTNSNTEIIYLFTECFGNARQGIINIIKTTSSILVK